MKMKLFLQFINQWKNGGGVAWKDRVHVTGFWISFDIPQNEHPQIPGMNKILKT